MGPACQYGNSCLDAAHLLKVKMLDFRLRMARNMATIRCHAFTVAAISLAALALVSPTFAESRPPNAGHQSRSLRYVNRFNFTAGDTFRGRVMLTGWIMYRVEPQYASGAYHTLEGLLMMALGLAMLGVECVALDQLWGLWRAGQSTGEGR